MSDFADRLTRWQRLHGRHDLPWQVADPYRVWLSEVMLQQTQVGTVIPYYQRFVTTFPDVATLAAAPLDEVLAHWAGLGYYSRARNLHAAAQKVMTYFGGVFPRSAQLLETLPGIGRSTSAAVAGFCYGERVAILDGNVKRVLSRWAGIAGFPGEKAVEKQLWALAESLLPVSETDMPAFTQGMMDLGATLCTRSKPQCQPCPLRGDCRARLEDCTAELPARKPKKSVPERETYMLLLRHQGRWLLQKRPPTGIWGGLWSLPETAAIDAGIAYCQDRLGLRVELAEALPELVHTFTHFRLTISPLVLDVLEMDARVAEDDHAWFTRSDALQAGIPTPVRKLLQLV
ncbi:A/G-specific adenine glycosylase [Chitinimonas arctica]|uniref:Adenine DNA glycosylase n=1 Tax=Chitinimonas arctica TaxID=2594795 RepID=A0A516SD85_9NEIS|nr:A/G-specific adenine glycosylase [Chitinimonas arctica]QDQ26111.1 A/G-specific adenine glycosylase [Chitinimonas arctica]